MPPGNQVNEARWNNEMAKHPNNIPKLHDPVQPDCIAIIEVHIFCLPIYLWTFCMVS